MYICKKNFVNIIWKVAVLERWLLWSGATVTGILICSFFGASARTNNDNDNNDSDGVW